MLTLTPTAAAAIAAHAVATYPDECVGLLMGQVTGTTIAVLVTFPVKNRWCGQVALGADDDPGSRRDRFYLDPRDHLQADCAAQAAGLEIVGCYHSHPDHAAAPSERDRVGAQASGGSSFAFIIQSVYHGVTAALASWLLVEGGARFAYEELMIVEA